MTTRTGPIVFDLSALELQALLARGEACLVDVREEDEQRAERIAGAESMPLSRFDARKLRREGPPPVLYCRSGRRSKEAVQALLREGWGEVHQLSGGIESWKAAGLPVERNDRAPLPLMRQVQIAIGAGVLTGCTLGFLVHPGFYGLAAFFGAGLVFAGLSGTCGLALLLERMPWNARAAAGRATPRTSARS
ncbi:MAG: rhodanese-like domain-containing protein [Planctomycetes bacterium]|nr:rhodanese-like domain-containing protein [Planctomycetota bacterium]